MLNKELLLNFENKKCIFSDSFKFKLYVDMYPDPFAHGYGFIMGECGSLEYITPSDTTLRSTRVTSTYNSYDSYINITAPLSSEELIDIPANVTIFIEDINYTYSTKILFSTNSTNIINFVSKELYNYLEEYFESGGLTGWIHITVESE